MVDRDFDEVAEYALEQFLVDLDVVNGILKVGVELHVFDFLRVVADEFEYKRLERGQRRCAINGFDRLARRWWGDRFGLQFDDRFRFLNRGLGFGGRFLDGRLDRFDFSDFSGRFRRGFRWRIGLRGQA